MFVLFVLQRRHPSIHTEVSAMRHTESTPGWQPSISSFVQPTAKYGIHDSRQQSLTDAIVMFIAGDLCHCHWLRAPSFGRSCTGQTHATHYPAGSTSQPRSYMTSSSMELDIKFKLKQAQTVWLTIDLWSNCLMKSCIGITGHFILDWTMQSIMLACKRFKGRHTAENIYEQYQETVSAFDIAAKILSIVTDNATNIVKPSPLIYQALRL